MEKRMGAILLVAGTCIGSGMIALPMVLAKIGLIPAIMCMLAVWLVMYYTSLLNLELNLQAGSGLSLGALGRYFSGKGAEWTGTISLKLLSYSLLAVFIYGGSSVVKSMLASHLELEVSMQSIATLSAIAAAGLLLLPIHWIDYLNRILFMGLLGIVALLIAGLATSIDWTDLPWHSQEGLSLSVWPAIIPVVFTSFGFQVIFHTLTNYCNKNVRTLKIAFLWGSLIPAAIYILWTCCILGVVHHDAPAFYQQMASGNAEVGELVQVLSSIAKWPLVQILVWWISLLAIVTSVLGVGVGLKDTLNALLEKPVAHPGARAVVASLLTVVPAYWVVVFVPNAFITVLGFAGMILAVIAILLPVYLFMQMSDRQWNYPELDKRGLIYLSAAAALIVILSELFNII